MIIRPPLPVSTCVRLVASRSLPEASRAGRDSAVQLRSPPSARGSGRAPAAWQTDRDRRHPTTAVLRCRLFVRGTQTRVRRMAVRAGRSVPAHSVHRTRGADPSLLLQSRSWSRLEAGSLAKALQNRTQQRCISSALYADQRSAWKLDMDRTAGRRSSRFWLSLLVFRVRYRHRNQRYARLAQFATLKGPPPREHLVRVHAVSTRHFGHADARVQRQLYDLQLL